MRAHTYLPGVKALFTLLIFFLKLSLISTNPLPLPDSQQVEPATLKPEIPSLHLNPRGGIIIPASLPNGVYTAPLFTPDPTSKQDLTKHRIIPTLIQPLNLSSPQTEYSPQTNSSPTTPLTKRDWWSPYKISITCRPRQISAALWEYYIRDRRLSSVWGQDYLPPNTMSVIKVDNSVVYLCNYSADKLIFPNVGWYYDIDRLWLETACGSRGVGWAWIRTLAQSYGREKAGEEICWS